MEFRSAISPLLVRELQEAFPDQSPGLAWTDREIWFKAGQASVVAVLDEACKEQQNAINPIREV